MLCRGTYGYRRAKRSVDEAPTKWETKGNGPAIRAVCRAVSTERGGGGGDGDDEIVKGARERRSKREKETERGVRRKRGRRTFPCVYVLPIGAYLYTMREYACTRERRSRAPRRENERERERERERARTGRERARERRDEQ